MTTYAEAQRLIGTRLEQIERTRPFAGSERDWADFFAGLREGGLTRLSVGHQIRCAAALTRLRAAGHDLSDRKLLADFLVPILAISEDEEKLVRSELDVWLGLPPEARRRRSGGTIVDRLHLSGWTSIALAGGLVALLVAIVVAWSFDLFGIREALQSRSPPIEASSISSIVVEPLPSTTSWLDLLAQWFAGLPTLLLVGTIVASPIVVVIAFVLRQRDNRKEQLARQVGEAVLYASVQVPKEPDPVFGANEAQRMFRALQDWQQLRSMPSQQLDVPAVVRSTARNLGRPDWLYGTRRERPAYVLLVDRGGASDHLALVAAAIEERLRVAGLVFQRYDYRDDPRRLWSRDALSRRGRPERLATVAARHRGERLLLVSDGETLRGPVWPEFAEGIGQFSRRVMLHPTPEPRWGDPERALTDAGVLIVPIAAGGLQRAGAIFSEADTVDAVLTAAFEDGEDPFLADLRINRARYLSDLPPATEEIGRLVRRVRFYLADPALYTAFVAVAVFPKIEPAITLYLAHAVNKTPLTVQQLGTLARLPWLRAGRAPAWLQIALLKSLDAPTVKLLQETFTAILGGTKDNKLPAVAEVEDSAKTISIAGRRDWRNIWERLPALGYGEHIFIAFMKGEELTIDPPKALRLPWWRRLDPFDWIVMGLGLVAATFAVGYRNEIIDLLDALNGPSDAPRYALIIAIVVPQLLLLVTLAANAGVPLLRRLAPILPQAGLTFAVLSVPSVLLATALHPATGLIALVAAVAGSLFALRPIRAALTAAAAATIVPKDVNAPIGLRDAALDILSNLSLVGILIVQFSGAIGSTAGSGGLALALTAVGALVLCVLVALPLAFQGPSNIFPQARGRAGLIGAIVATWATGGLSAMLAAGSSNGWAFSFFGFVLYILLAGRFKERLTSFGRTYFGNSAIALPVAIYATFSLLASAATYLHASSAVAIVIVTWGPSGLFAAIAALLHRISAFRRGVAPQFRRAFLLSTLGYLTGISAVLAFAFTVSVLQDTSPGPGIALLLLAGLAAAMAYAWVAYRYIGLGAVTLAPKATAVEAPDTLSASATVGPEEAAFDPRVKPGPRRTRGGDDDDVSEYGDADDDLELRALGYQPQLQRRIGAFGSIAITIVIVNVLMGGLTMFPQAMSSIGGAGAGIGWIVGCAVSGVFALAMAQLAAAYPTAGGPYYWAGRLGGRFWGWVIGWVQIAGLISLTLTIESGTAYTFARTLGPAFGLSLAVLERPVIETGLVLVQGAMLLLGTAFLFRLISIFAFIIVATAVVLAGVLLLFAAPDFTRLWTFTNFSGDIGGNVFPQSDSMLQLFALSLFLPLFTISGFDAPAHMSEETVQASRTVPRGMLIGLIVSAILGWILVSVFAAVVPIEAKTSGLGNAGLGWDAPFSTIEAVLPASTRGWLYVLIVLTQFGSGVVALMAASRLIFAFARDGALSGLFSRTTRTRGTPVAAIVLAMGLVAGYSWLSSFWTIGGINLLALTYNASLVLIFFSYFIPIMLGFSGVRSGERPAYAGRWRIGGPYYRVVAILCAACMALIGYIASQPPDQGSLWLFTAVVVLAALGWFGGATRFRIPTGYADPTEPEPSKGARYRT